MIRYSYELGGQFMTTINKKSLVEAIVQELGITKKDATVAVDTVFNTIAETLAEGGKADISGFGKFEITERAARTGINPATKEKIQIAASKSPKFKAAKALKDAVK